MPGQCSEVERVVKSSNTEAQWMGIPALLATSCVALAKLLNLSVP